MATQTGSPWLIGLFVGLGVLGFGGLLVVAGDVALTWLIAGAVVAATAVVALFVTPPEHQYTARGLVAFGSGAIALWIVFELQPPLVTYASGSLGVVVGAAAGWLTGRQL